VARGGLGYRVQAARRRRITIMIKIKSGEPVPGAASTLV